MLRSLAVHILIAILWVILKQEVSLLQFLVGFVLGFFLLALFPSLLKSKTYVRRFWGLVCFFFYFLWIFIKANWVVAGQVLFVPRKKIQGKFISVGIPHLSWFETIVFAHLVTITPGTTSVWIATKAKILVVHALSKLPDEVIAKNLIDELLKPIQWFTR